MINDNSSETTQNNLLAQKLFEIRQDAISAALNAERGLEAIGIFVETAIVGKKERRQRKSDRRKNAR